MEQTKKSTKRARGAIMRAVLEAIGSSAEGIVDGFAAFLSAGYGASFSRINYEIGKRESARFTEMLEREEALRARQRYHNLIHALTRDGLVQKRTAKNKALLILTKEGRKKLEFFRAQHVGAFPPALYHKEAGDTFIIVTFDVPEKDRRKRDWLRAALKNLGLTMVQKSVWLGKIILPPAFLEDLHALRLVHFVEIFEVSKTGSLHYLT